MQEEAVPPHQIDPAIPAYIERTILKCLLKNPANRFQSIAQLENALNGSAGQNPAAAALPTRTANASRVVGAPATARVATPSLAPPAAQRKGTSPIGWVLLGALIVLGTVGVLNGMAKRKAAAEMIQPPAALPAPVPPEFAYVSSPPKSSAPVSKVKPEDVNPVEPTPHPDPGAELTVAPYTNFKPEIAKNHATPAPKSERPAQVSPRTEVGPVKKTFRPSPDAAAATLRADEAARNAGKNSPAKKSAQPSASNSPDTAASTAGTSRASYLWIGRFQREDRAKAAEKKISALGLPAAVLTKHGDSGDFYIVYSGPYLNEKIASAMEQLEAKGFSNVRAVPLPLADKNTRQ
jgi:SPOR domain